ncbi:MAG TPA: amidase family protein [Solirubrobacteraceae bacterium]|nr:amidase family protein [Solirubrobacteraceae bacterium]
MGLSDELSYATATEVAARIRAGELSPVEVVEATIARIQERNPSLNAIVFEGFDDARAAARDAERAVREGAELGPLHGVPTALKDLFDFKPGWPATFGGIRALKDNVIDAHCGFSERIEQGGAVIVGKTNSPVMGYRGVTDNALFGPSRNPFDLTRNTGGSSGGSAAAVADGLLTVAEGTDGGGSIRIPAAWCGVFGLQPSFGRVPNLARPNAFGGTNPFLYEGPLTRTVADAALAMTALGGYHPADPFSLRDEPDYLGALDRDISGMRIAYSPDLDVYPVDRRIAETVERAVAAFEEAGAHVEEVKLGITRDQRELSDLWCRLIMPLSHAGFAGMKAAGLDIEGDHADDLPPLFRRWLDATRDMTALDVIADQVIRSEIFDAVQGVFATHDLLVSPTLAAMPVENADDGDTIGPTEIEGVAVDPLIGWCMTYFTNYTGHPAASIPAGFADGLPVGMQIIGPRLRDGDVLAASAAFEALRPWQDGYARCRERPL